MSERLGSSQPPAGVRSDRGPAVRSGSLIAELYALAVTQQRTGQTAAAIETYRRCLALSPGSPEIHNNLGTALDQAGRLREAVECFERAQALDPGYVRPLVNLGRVLRLQGRASQALASLERALSLTPDNAGALTNLGFVLTDLGRRGEAIQHLRHAIALDPGLAEAHHALGRALLDSGDAPAAVDSLQRALHLKPPLLEACLPLAVSLLILQRLPEALKILERFLELRPDDPEALAERLNLSLRMCDWERAATTLQRLRKTSGGTARAAPFLLMGVSDAPEEHLEAARTRAAAIARDRIPHPNLHPNQRRRTHPLIRVAYLSGDFHTHATSFLIAELLELHDRSAFEVFGVSYGPDDGSALRRRVLCAFDEYLEAREKSDAEVAAWLCEREIDIAVDLKGYTAFSRPGIFAYRPAPVQVSYLGYPGTMAAPFIDYLVADRCVIPEAEERFYTEKIVFLPDSYQVNDRRRALSEETSTRTEAGLPADGFIFCCFNNSWKVTAPVFEVWMRLLARVPGSALWLLEDNCWAAESLRRRAAALGIGSERLVFCTRTSSAQHLARHRLADLFLDTFPYNAHTTASDALRVGLPLITCSGRTFASRVAGSLLRAVGLPELITASLEEYERLALDLALHPGTLVPLRERLRSRQALPLFDTPSFCHNLEAAYRRMRGVHEQGCPPETFAIERQRIATRL